MTHEEVIKVISSDNSLLSGLIGAVLGGLLSLGGVWLTLRRSKMDESAQRYKRVEAGMYVPHVEQNGTMYVRNRSGEVLVLKIRQKRLYTEPITATTRSSIKDSIYEGIALGSSKEFHPSSYSTKLKEAALAADELLMVQDCEMYGFRVEDYREILVATVLDFWTTDKTLKFRRTYIHRFTMGVDAPEPKAAWTPIYSGSKPLGIKSN